jgi:hypothetical protein
MVSDAAVSITDETGTRTTLTPFGNGIYKTDSLTFRGEIGKTYRLNIKTSNGKVYESDSCTMMPVPPIDSIYFDKDVKLTDNNTVTRQGLSVFLDSKGGVDDKYFMRWEFEEAWKFSVPLPRLYLFVNDTTWIQLTNDQINEYCWKSARSSGITTGAILSGSSGTLKKQAIQFISPELSDRLSIRYSILVKQYSVSQKEYDYWNNLQQVSETNGDIFGAQPFAVVSNIKNINNSTEQVLGYFQVSAVAKRRKYIDFNETIPLNLPFYHTTCQRITKKPTDYQMAWGVALTFEDLYTIFMSKPGYTFIEPVLDVAGKLQKMTFTTSECADCTFGGTTKKPDFWTDN